MKVITSFIFATCALVAVPQSIQDLLPSTAAEIKLKQDQLLAHIERQSAAVRCLFDQNAPIETIHSAWDYLHAEIMLNMATITQTKRIEKSLSDVVDQAAYTISQAYLENVGDSKQMAQSFEGYAMRHLNDAITPFDMYYLQRIADGYDHKIWASQSLRSISQALSKKPSEPFATYVSQTSPKRGDGQSFTVFTANVIFMPGDFTYYFGGIRPWPERIEALTEKLISLDADVLALQEVFDELGARALVDHLKNTYTYFYYDIGPHYFGLDLEKNGINSGLFLASKYPIANPKFTRYVVPNMQEAVYKGFFEVDILSQGQTIGHIVTTHLQPFDDKDSQQVRREEIEAIVDALEATADRSIANLLVGDINIDWGPEYAASPLPKHFFDPYNKNRDMTTRTVPVSESTLTDYFETYLWNPDKQDSLDPYGESRICDYALLFIPSDAPNTASDYTLTSTLVPLQSVEHRETALSDHQGLLLEVNPAH